ncbi:MAG: methionyl-tRNA formyltransferase [Victivallales bacterium]|nr:methionyl-tRNA formyltransferase [Victivallales bacterium]
MPLQSKVRVYFLSSGRIGSPILNALRQDARLDLVGVGSQPDKEAGRKKLATTPLATEAQKLGIAVDKPEKVNTPDFLEHLKSLNVELLVVASFGQILKPALLDLPRLGCLNVHASLLPKCRGASPIAQVILDGDDKTGVSFMKMDPGLDTGPVYCQSICSIEATDNVVCLEDKLGQLAAADIGNVICGIAEGTLQPVPQPAEGCTYAKKIKKSDGAADWRLPAEILARKVRAYYSWPYLFAILPAANGWKRISIKQAVVVERQRDCAPGTIMEATADSFVIACGQGALNIIRLIPEGRTEMSASEFLRGTRVAAGSKLPACTGDFLLNEANFNKQ